MASRVYRIFKTIPFHDGGREEFSNVYRYSHPGISQGVPQDVAVATLEKIKEMEREAHGPLVEFTRGESAGVGPLDGVLATDVEVSWNNEPGQATAAFPDNWTPENVVMLQLRVGKLRWLRKFLHLLTVPKEGQTGGVNFNFDVQGESANGLINYAANITNPEVTVDGNTENIVLEAGNGTPADGPMNIDPRIRWHDMKY